MSVDVLVNDLVAREYFIGADCLFLPNGVLVRFSMASNSLVVGDPIVVAEVPMISIIPLCKKTAFDGEYVAGESTSHGSVGFFYKKVGNLLQYVLLCTTSNPFFDIEFDEKSGHVGFRSALDLLWLVKDDKVETATIAAQFDRPGPARTACR